MKQYLKHITFLFLPLFLYANSYAQEPKMSNFYNEIKKFDLSTILMADSILAEDREDGKDEIKRAEIIGFIGDDFQRFYIHFVSIIKNPTKPHQYLVYGKTKVKEAVCSFQGSITIKEASIFNSFEIANYQQGFANCEVLLFEDNKQTATGYLKGNLKTKFLIDNKGEFRYDAIQFAADGFSNNQFVGNWTSYKTNISKKCNWGDYRIPNCGDLDIGAGEFSVNEKYIKNGWKSYMTESIPENSAIIKPTVDKNYKDKNWWE